MALFDALQRRAGLLDFKQPLQPPRRGYFDDIVGAGRYLHAFSLLTSSFKQLYISHVALRRTLALVPEPAANSSTEPRLWSLHDPLRGNAASVLSAVFDAGQGGILPRPRW